MMIQRKMGVSRSSFFHAFCEALRDLRELNLRECKLLVALSVEQRRNFRENGAI